VEKGRVERIGGVEIVLCPWGELPEAPDALVLPEDTHLVLQAVTTELDPGATPLDLWVALERAARAEKRPLGSVIIEDGAPRGVHTIARVVVYDFDQEPICHQTSVATGLAAAFEALMRRACAAVAVAPLGTMRGEIPWETYLETVCAVVARLGVGAPWTLYLLSQDPPMAGAGPGS
jgi:hypothetical protein